MKPLSAQHVAVIKRIQSNMPSLLLDQLMVERVESPALKEMVDRGLEDPDVSDETKKKLKIIKDSGVSDRVISVVNEKIEQQIDNYYKREINKAIKKGELPNPSKNQKNLLWKTMKHLSKSKKS